MLHKKVKTVKYSRRCKQRILLYWQNLLHFVEYFYCLTFFYIIIIGIQPLGRSGHRPEFSQATGMALVRCILGKLLGVACHCFPPFLDVPTCHHQVPPRLPRRERSQRRKWELWARILSGNFAEMSTSTPFRDLLHAANLRHGTDGLFI